ncbi:hypothetical protein Pint_28263 [Pistacia integerrima]|uniref:Uncharacterized protein n=1 Tax=Pistacia integerrima TaxID=434235 RepID=A0ACC0YPK3_9ROSI|nr:hypothetical protein Pint_28263 [Pistacia integerrima]
MGDYNDPFMRNQNAAVQARTKAQNRANVLQLKLIGQSHPTGLTANLLKLFEPRPPLEYKPAIEKRKCPSLTGMAQFVSNFAEPGDPEYAPPVPEAETPAQRRARIHKLRLEKGAEKAAEELQKYDPSSDPNISGDPYKTLFVARLSYETTESRIKREFESYGPIKRVGIFEHPQWVWGGLVCSTIGKFATIHQLICNSSNGGDASREAIPMIKRVVTWLQKVQTSQVRLVTDKETNKPKGYAFIEYMHTRDMKAAYKQADGRKLDGRRVLVDVERGRTVPNWRPRRLGGGLGTTRVGGEEVNQRFSGREQEQSRPPSRSEEPRIREDRHGDRVNSHLKAFVMASLYQKNLVKEEGTKRGSERSPASAPMTGRGSVITEMIDTIEIVTGTEKGRETGVGTVTENATELVIVIMVETVDVIMSGAKKETVDVIMSVIVIAFVKGKGAKIMNLVTLTRTVDIPVIGMTMIVLNQNMIGIDMGKGTMIMVMKMMVSGMNTLTIMNVIAVMVTVTMIVIINIMIVIMIDMIKWRRMITVMTVQCLSHVTGSVLEILIVNTEFQKGHLPWRMVARKLVY